MKLDLEQRVKALEYQVRELSEKLNELKNLYFNNVVTIDQAHQLFQQFEDRLQKLEQVVSQIMSTLN